MVSDLWFYCVIRRTACVFFVCESVNGNRVDVMFFGERYELCFFCECGDRMNMEIICCSVNGDHVFIMEIGEW